MKKLLTLTIVAVGLAFGANGAWASGPYPTALTDGTYGPVGSVTPNSAGGFQIYNAVNQLLGTSYTNNAQIDSLEYTGNTSTWTQTSGGGYAVIGLGAWNSDTVEVYNSSTPSVLLNPIGTSFSGQGPVGDGSNANPYVGAPSPFAPGTNFGLALNTVGETALGAHDNTTPVGGINWYSDVSLNSDGMDHMIVYNLSSLTGTQVWVYDPNTNSEQLVTLDDPYLVSFEDLPLNDNGANADLDYSDVSFLVNGAAPVPEPMTVALFGFGLLAMAGFALRRKFAVVA